jgi:signal transduction histidine kinase
MVAAGVRLAGQPRLLALALAAGYLVFGLVWILFSDRAGEALFGTAESLSRFQTWKGAAFIVFTSAFVYLAARAADGHARPDEPTGADRRRPDIAVLLALLVLATALPLVALLGWHVQRETDAQLEGAERLVRAVARDTAMGAAGFVESRVRLAAVLAARTGVRRLATGPCETLLQEVPELDGKVQDLSTFDRDGRVVCGREARVPVLLPQWAQVLGGGDAWVGPVFRDPSTSAWMVPVAHPILDEQGRLAGAVELLVSAASLVPLVQASPLTGGGALGLLDQNGALIVRQPALEGAVGRRIADPLVEAARGGGARVFVTTGLDGKQRLYAMSPVAGSRWSAGAGVPLDELYAPARRAFLTSVLAAAVVMLMCTLLVLRLARSITAPVRALRRTAEAVAAGDFSRRAPEGGPAELAALGEGFNRMLERLPQLQREVQEAEQNRQAMIEKLSRHVPDMIFVYVYSPSGPPRLAFASGAIRRMFELEPEDVAADATPALDRIHWLDRERVDRSWDESGRRLSDVEVEFRVMLPKAGLRHLLARANAEPGDGAEICWYGSITDVTELRASRQALADLNESLEQRIADRTSELAVANEALESFSYSVAHDLRAPLGSIGGFALAAAEALERGEPQRAQGYLERVAANTQRMDTLIEGFLSLARVGRERLVEAPVDLARLVDEVVAELAPPSRVRLAIAPMPRVLADQALLRQVWANLLSNAIKYSSRRDQAEVRIDYESTGPELVFSVSDNGVGFDPEYAAKLFAPFSRLHKNEEFEGTGIGLALVRRIVERHGGRTWAASVPGEGATFSFSLPRDRLIPEGA